MELSEIIDRVIQGAKVTASGQFAGVFFGMTNLDRSSQESVDVEKFLDWDGESKTLRYVP